MKKILAFILTALLLTSALPALAQGEMPDWYPEDISAWTYEADPDAPRLKDEADILTDDEETLLLEEMQRVSAETGIDVVLWTSPTAYGMDQESLIEDYYDFNGYGLGEDHDGMVMLVCMDPEDRGWAVAATGRMETIYTREAAEALDDVLYPFMKAGDYAEGLTGWVCALPTLVTKGIPYAPDWYPDLSEHYVWAPDPTAPRVNDRGGILTDDEERMLSEKIAAVSAETGMDVVLYTDDRDWGINPKTLMTDYLTYGGYGLGKDGSAFGLFFNTDDNDWTAASVGSAEERYTYDAAYSINRALSSPVYEERYADAFALWIDALRDLVIKGLPFAPGWYPDHPEFYLPAPVSAPHVVDDAGLLTPEDTAALEAKAAALSEAYGVDVLVHTAESSYDLTGQEYADAFLAYTGYGLTAPGGALVLCRFADGTPPVSAGSRDMDELCSEGNKTRLEQYAQKKSGAADAAKLWLSKAERMLKTGKTPYAVGGWIAALIWACVLGFIPACISLSAAKSKMKSVAKACEASGYLVPGSFRLLHKSDTMTGITTSEKYSPVERSSSGSGSSSRSGTSYHSSHSGHSGISHSSSSHKF